MKKIICLCIGAFLLAGTAAAQPAAKTSTPRGTLFNETATTVSAPSMSVETGTNFTVPVTISDTTGLGIIAYQFDLHYDPAVVQPQQVGAVDVAGTLSSQLSVIYNPNIPGNLKVAVYGPYPLAGSGTLLNFKFTAVGPATSASSLTWVNFMFNEGDPGASVTGGQVTIVPKQAGPSLTRFSGRESSPGTFDNSNLIHHGNTFVMVSGNNANFASLTISLDRVSESAAADDFRIVGGQWTLMIYEEGLYVGAIYGEVMGGTGHDVVDGAGHVLFRELETKFRVTGGMERYETIAPEPFPRGSFSSRTNYQDRNSSSGILIGIL